jgi:GTP pyrophosphokinase
MRPVSALPEQHDADGRELIDNARRLSAGLAGERRHWSGERMADHAAQVARIVGELGLDAQSVAAAYLIDLPPNEGSVVEPPRVGQPALDPQITALAHGVARLASIQMLHDTQSRARKTSEKMAQLEAVRKMLLAMVEDIRVVLIKLADQLQCLRYLAGRDDSDVKRNTAQETLDLLAPLANRLGVWQLKWELEDLAFRCVDAVTYKAIARELDERRTDREHYLAHVMSELRDVLAGAGLTGELSGRPKHIYSIWKKMQRKGLRFEQLSDVRAVRVLVETERDCYSALGLIHQLWTPVPGEFDDYIARPKANDYRSLHTAVVGPANKIIEVQIRTREMHEHAELGVAAHWRYKEASRGDPAYDRKIAWLRTVLDWRDDMTDAKQVAQSFHGELQDDTVYALTPQGRVVDLPAGATPVDFAYQVHTELGHRCRGARIDGKLAPLNRPLRNGEVVEIVTAKIGGPSRDWLNPALGYLASNRGRAKVRQWFNSQAREEAAADGRLELEKALQRLGHSWGNPETLSTLLGYQGPEELFIAFHRGDITLRELRIAVEGDGGEDEARPISRRSDAADRRGAVLVVGLDQMLTSLARCCKPVPPDAIVGFVSKGRGISVHRAGCRNLASFPSERLIAAQWADRAANRRFETDVEIVGDAQGVSIRDVLDVFASEKMRVVGTSTHSGGRHLRIVITVETTSIEHLQRPIASLCALDGVMAAHRC